MTTEQKHFIVENLATFQSVTDIVTGMKTLWGLRVDPRSIMAYDPTNRNCRIGKRLRTYWEQCRAGYITEVANHGLAHQAHRLKLIGDIVAKAATSKDFNAALKGLELAAKETGQIQSFSTVRHEGIIAHVHGTAEEAKAELAMRLQAFIDARPDTLSLPAASCVDATARPVDTTEGA